MSDQPHKINRRAFVADGFRAAGVVGLGGAAVFLAAKHGTGYFPTKNFVLATGAENQLCPTGAISRKFIEENGGERFFEYTIDESLCIGCGKCVLGCRLMNGSLYMQIRHDRCVNCNECAIAIACPTQAIRRVPSSSPNLLSRAATAALESQRHRRQADRGAKST
jgi:Fe-S-cluster-containing hydrogenase component 2